MERLSRADLERLVREHFAHVRGLLVRLTGSAEDADDLAQECFLRARTGMTPSARSHERRWLGRVALNLARDHARSAGRRRVRDERAGGERPQSDGDSPPVVLAQTEFAEAVRVAVAELPDRLRLPLVLRTHEGWSYDEIAEELGIRPTTARTQVMDARRELERRLRPHLDSEVR